MAIALYGEKETTVQDIDYIGLKYNLFRLEDESIEDYKERVLSVFVYPGNSSASGLSAYLTRIFGVSPRIIGYLWCPEDHFIKWNAGNLSAYDYLGNLEESYSLLLGSDLTVDTLSNLGELAISLELIDQKDRAKGLAFIMPFENYKTRITQKLRPGLSHLEDRPVVPDSIRSNSDYVITQVDSPDLIVRLGDFYFDGNGKIITYDDGRQLDFEISYTKKWDLIPLVYCPISIYGLQSLIPSDAENFIVPGLNMARAPSGANNDEINKDALQFFWNGFVNNSRAWKSSGSSPVSVKGTYYGK